MDKKILSAVVILLFVSFVCAQYPFITTPKITFIPIVTTTTTTTTTLIKCSGGCECMTEAQAKNSYKNPVKCSKEVCGYYTSQTAVALIMTPKYCFMEGGKATTTTTTARLSTPTTTLSYVVRPPAEIGCTSCKSCTDEIKGGKTEVKVGRDLSSTTGTCILFDASNVVLDCQGHKISGFGVGLEFYYGVDLRGSGNTIRNCTIEGFEAGIAAYSAKNSLIENNTIRENAAGIWLGGGRLNNATGEVADGSDGNRLLKNTITENQEGVYLAGNKNTRIEENRLCRNTVADIYTSPYAKSSGNTLRENICDLIYNWNSDSDVTWCETTCTADAMTSVSSSSGLRDALSSGDYGTITLTRSINSPDGLSFGASHVTLDCDGHWITGSGSGVGVEIKNKVNVELRDCGVENYGTGVLMDGASHSRLFFNGIRNNDYGLVMRGGYMPSRSNNVSDNTIVPNDVYGVYLEGGVWDNKFTTNEIEGRQYSLYTNARCDNSIPESNKGSGGRKIGYYHDTSGLNIAYPADRRYSELILCNVRDSTFSGVEVDNSGTNSDGIIVMDSRNVEFTNPSVREAYHGIAVINSTDIRLISGQVTDLERDCISVEKSSDTLVEQGNLRGCDRGVYIYLSSGTLVKDVGEITDYEIAGIQFYMSDSNTLEGNTITGGNGPASVKGITVEESSDENTIRGNTIRDTGGGIYIDPTSNRNRLEENTVCNNSNDVHNQGTDNTGRDNICSRSPGWSDEGTKGCSQCCSPAVDDIDGDGVDDACDCADLYQGFGELGIDCGGKCSECVECTWCDSKIVPLRIKGRPNDGYIDVVFVPEEDWGSNWTGFEARIKEAIRARFLELDAISIRPIHAGYEDMFNFYLYRGGKGDATSDADSCYDPEGPEGYLCIGCKGWLPGEKAYHDWVYACSFTCALTLGFGCGCFAYEPDHFWEHASFADSAGIIYTNPDIRGCSGFGPTSHFQSEYQNQGAVIIHEFGHSLLGLTDEYCGDTAYSRAGTKPNIWNSLSDCMNTAASEGWTNGTCRQIRNVDENGTVTCSKDKYRYDSDTPRSDVMRANAADSVFKEADVRRINHVFSNWPSGGSKGIISYVEFRQGKMRGIMSRVVPNHPDLGMWMTDFVGLTASAEGREIDRFTFSDPRVTMADSEGSPVRVFSEDTMFTLVVPMHSGVRWLNIFNGSTGELMVTVDLGPAVWNYCEEVNWTDPYCESVDIDDNKVSDVEETGDWSPERLQNMSFDDRPELPEEIRQRIAADETPKRESIVGGFDLNLILVAALLLVVILVLLLLKRRKNSRSTAS
ncbi:MAG: right-handed parallel beta-helix repeat-containing protein [Candidatus Altiarchaeota archaeon]|nr:right-handed parallel beta-helix repeat-containing protein [Candidatus Altiarchaeota archaeon]